MPPRCNVCDHPQKAEIEKAILKGNESMCGIARRYAVSNDSVERHFKRHMTKDVVAALEDGRKRNGKSLIDQLHDIQERSLAVLDTAGDDHAMLLKAVAECRKNIETMAKLTGELDTRPVQATQVNVGVNGDGQAPITVVIRALADEEVR